MTSQAEKATLTVKDAADALHCSIGAVYKRFDQGELPGYRVGRKVLIYANSIERFKARYAVRSRYAVR
jgi:excisionase family DNA binding protein